MVKLNAQSAITKRMHSEHIPQIIIDNFLRLYAHVVSGETGEIAERQIQGIRSLPRHEALQPYALKGKAQLKKLAVVKLNGGLGTSMGLDRAKTLLEIKPGVTFLDVIAQQASNDKTPLVFMNSFSTDSDTKKFFKKYKKIAIQSFVQNKHPKIDQKELALTNALDDALNWNPPGHGDLYPALVLTGVLDHLEQQKFTHLFISNGDNLGAVADPAILGYMQTKKIPFIMEVADRTLADKKGGHLAKYKDGRLMLREVAQCPEKDSEAFQDITKYKFFNTNSLWIEIAALKKVMAQHGGILPLPLIRNAKTIDPTDKRSQKVYQLETAMGAAIELFPKAQAVVVPKSRFVPVKKCLDLLLLWSDVYALDQRGRLVLKAKQLPIITLDDNYTLCRDFKRLIKAPPSLIKCKSLTVQGPVVFGPGVVIEGTVTIINKAVKPKILKNIIVKDQILEL